MKVRLYGLLLSVLPVLGCSTAGSSIDMDNMESAEKEFNRQQREKLLAYMPFNRIFPNMPARELARAAGRGELRTIERLVSSGVDVNTRGEKNATALYWALRRSNHSGFVKLLELGADPNIVFDDGGTVMHWAVDHKNVDFLRSALEYGGDPNLLAGRQT
ncbi:MAG: ankyrin repeat domain-containing protein, partial [Pseudomonadota bacterium]